jgi:hypothetical protein
VIGIERIWKWRIWKWRIWNCGGKEDPDRGMLGEERMYQDSTEDPAGFEIACSVVSSNGKEP